MEEPEAEQHTHNNYEKLHGHIFEKFGEIENFLGKCQNKNYKKGI